LLLFKEPKRSWRHISFSIQTSGHGIMITQSVNLIHGYRSYKVRREMPVLIETLLGVLDLSWNLSTCLIAIIHAVIDILLKIYQPLLFAELTIVSPCNSIDTHSHTWGTGNIVRKKSGHRWEIVCLLHRMQCNV
jgi:hypothetical protein